MTKAYPSSLTHAQYEFLSDMIPEQRQSLSTVLNICNKYSNLILEESIAYLRDVF
ncbi:MAG: hypothetical protein V7K89_10685 [Nostoc sp.]|uniref:hypothetical protein n=1 Tax=Nostoc sp. TaxID=1180 RepID=UPI002FFBC177